MTERILCDVDGVLADFTGTCVRTINELFDTGYESEDVHTWDFSNVLPDHPDSVRMFWDVMNDVGVARNLEPFNHAAELVRELSKLGELWMVTSPMDTNPTWCYERLQWLRAHLGIDKHRVVFASDKSAVDGVVLLDDRAANLEQWEERSEPGGPYAPGTRRRGILWKQPYSGPWDGLRTETVAGAVWAIKAHLRDLKLGGY